MEVWFRWFSFSIGWFLGSMLIFRGVTKNQGPTSCDGHFSNVFAKDFCSRKRFIFQGKADEAKRETTVNTRWNVGQSAGSIGSHGWDKSDARKFLAFFLGVMAVTSSKNEETNWQCVYFEWIKHDQTAAGSRKLAWRIGIFFLKDSSHLSKDLSVLSTPFFTSIQYTYSIYIYIYMLYSYTRLYTLYQCICVMYTKIMSSFMGILAGPPPKATPPRNKGSLMFRAYENPLVSLNKAGY